MENRLIVSSSPHIRSNVSSKSIMRDVVIALLPASLFGIYNFGIRAALILVIAVISAIATEAAIQKLKGDKISINDYSAVVTGLLLGMSLSVAVPLWIPIVGSVFAIAIVKQAFGGLGYNFVNPALAARAFLVSSWAGDMSIWPIAGFSNNAITGPTTLATLKYGVGELPTIMDAAIGNIGGCIGETSALLLILGGIYLVYRQVISIRIPLVYIGTTAVLTYILVGFNLQETIYYILTGGLIIVAIFMATDYVSSPISPKAQIIYAIGAGVFTTIIRLYGGYPDGVTYSVLLMNVAAPLLDKFCPPKLFGGRK